ncbi:LORELEI-LIKE-GPI ANCHORED PROTEIN 3 [Zea mays]|uniref:LORELEI-LIKE-GPI ANCHORED PROTEIN 3 n=1 Tax=Zea mays TaxID=4577 RepID=A0A1D6HIN9_MAIZE|nr:LORELEI-LIKE-GPI ANCHORED PROTEIN 3 [Zea mays]
MRQECLRARGLGAARVCAKEARASSGSVGPPLQGAIPRVVDRGETDVGVARIDEGCPVNFEFQNYTIITSKCKGPKFPASQCCAALKEFACPFNNYLNDESNECASTMFSYINLYGKYPPGLFSSECKEGKMGLSCADVPRKDSSTANSGYRAQSSLLALITVLSVVAALFY